MSALAPAKTQEHKRDEDEAAPDPEVSQRLPHSQSLHLHMVSFCSRQGCKATAIIRHTFVYYGDNHKNVPRGLLYGPHT